MLCVLDFLNNLTLHLRIALRIKFSVYKDMRNEMFVFK